MANSNFVSENHLIILYEIVFNGNIIYEAVHLVSFPFWFLIFYFMENGEEIFLNAIFLSGHV